MVWFLCFSHSQSERGEVLYEREGMTPHRNLRKYNP